MSDVSGGNYPAIRAIFTSLVGDAHAANRDNHEGLIITSPYLTGNLLESIIKDIPASKIKVLTTFRAEDFASGASSLSTLRALVSQGVDLRYLEDLHAKIIVSPDLCFVGSHNLTVGALRNKEATFATSDFAAVRLVNENLQTWIAASYPITSQMIDDMEEQVAPLAASYNDIRKAASNLDESVRDAEKNRQELERRRREEERREHQRQKTQEALRRAREVHAGFRKAVRALPSSTRVSLTLQKVVSEATYSSHQTLLALGGEDLTTWWVDGEKESLTKRHRYLLIMPETGRLGWPALNKTRLTKFGIGLSPTRTSVAGFGRTWDVLEIDLNQNLETLSNWNVRFELRNRGSTFYVMMLFNLEGLKVVDVKSKSTDRVTEQITQELSNDGRLNRRLQQILIDPFRYKSNSLGVAADRFCEGMSWSFWLSLKSWGYRKFFCLESH